MMYFEKGSEVTKLTSEDLQEGVEIALGKLGVKKKVLMVPPDFTRFHSRSGDLATSTYNYYKDSVTDILPALGTHVGMTDAQIATMFPGVPNSLFRVHDWRNDVITIGKVSKEIKIPAYDKEETKYLSDTIKEGCLGYLKHMEVVNGVGQFGKIRIDLIGQRPLLTFFPIHHIYGAAP